MLVRLLTMREALALLLSAIVVTYFPVTVVSFCSASAAQHQLHAGGRPHAHAARASAVDTAAAHAADNTPTTATHPVHELGDNDDGSSSSSIGISSSSSSERFESFAKFLVETQAAICLEAEASDGRASFCTDRWEREGASKVGVCCTRAHVCVGGCVGVCMCVLVGVFHFHEPGTVTYESTLAHMNRLVYSIVQHLGCCSAVVRIVEYTRLDYVFPDQALLISVFAGISSAFISIYIGLRHHPCPGGRRAAGESRLQCVCDPRGAYT